MQWGAQSLCLVGLLAALPCQQNGQEWSRKEAGRKQFYDGERVSEKRGTISQPGHSTFYGLGRLLAYYVKRHCTGRIRPFDISLSKS